MSGAMGARSADAHPPRPPQSPSQPQPPQAQPHHPPRAYPAPPNPTSGPPPAVPGQPGGQGYPQGGHSGQTPMGQTPSGQTRVAGAHSNQHPTGQHGTGQHHTGQSAARRPRTGARTVPRVRKARLRVAKVDPWSVMKVGFLLSVALGICTVVAVSVLWMVMDAMGVFSAIGGTVSDATSTDDSSGFDLVAFLSLSRVLTFTGVVAAIDVVLATALATLGAFVYNLSAGFVGGIEVTLAEDE